MQKLIEDPVVYHTKKMMDSGEIRATQLIAQTTHTNKALSKITYIPRKLYGGYRCYKEHGMFYTMKRVYQKIMRKVKR